MLTLMEAADRFGVKRDRLKRAALDGRLSALKVTGGLRMPYMVKASDVAAFLASDKSRRGPKKKASPQAP